MGRVKASFYVVSPWFRRYCLWPSSYGSYLGADSIASDSCSSFLSNFRFRVSVFPPIQ